MNGLTPQEQREHDISCASRDARSALARMLELDPDYALSDIADMLFVALERLNVSGVDALRVVQPLQDLQDQRRAGR